MSTPQIAYIKRKDGSTAVHAKPRYLPIVFVPGTMATRLVEPVSGKQVWNPLGAPTGNDPGSFAIDIELAGNISMELVPDDTPYERQSKHEEVQHIRNYYNIVSDEAGGPMLKKLAKARFEVDGVEVQPIVYVAGYDWRVDQAKSALRVAEVVDEALRETGEQRVIMLSHSQGALVALYYQRVLGGESKVFAYFNMAGANLGFPEVFEMLKHGVEGFYVGEFLDGVGDLGRPETEARGKRNLMFESLRTLAGAHEHHGENKLKSTFLTSVYFGACIGAGRFLSRYEFAYFIRQFTGFYAMLPNAIYCKNNPHFLFFDPLATGHPPVGKMIKFPTMLDASIQAAGEIGGFLGRQTEKQIDNFKENADDFFSGKLDEDFSESARTTRNVVTLCDVLKQIAEVDDDDKSGMERLMSLGGGLYTLYKALDRMFLDCRNPRDLYFDIYTGFMDYPEFRGMCAANLEVAFRTHDALTINPRMEPSKRPSDYVMKFIEGLWYVIKGEPWDANWAAYLVDGVKAGASHVLPGGKNKTIEKVQKERKAEEADVAKKKKIDDKWSGDDEPKAYMHPNTYAVVCEKRATQTTYLAFQTLIESRGDSNVVESEILPDWCCRALGLRGNPFDDKTWEHEGDDRITKYCFNPPKGTLSNEYVHVRKLADVGHSKIPGNPQTSEYLIAVMNGVDPEEFVDGANTNGLSEKVEKNEFLADFLAGKTPNHTKSKGGKS